MTTYLSPQAKRERIAELGDRLDLSETVVNAAKIYAFPATVLSLAPTFVEGVPVEVRAGLPLALVAPALAVGVYQLGKMAVTLGQLRRVRRARRCRPRLRRRIFCLGCPDRPHPRRGVAATPAAAVPSLGRVIGRSAWSR